jgi:hypothetical protein
VEKQSCNGFRALTQPTTVIHLDSSDLFFTGEGFAQFMIEGTCRRLAEGGLICAVWGRAEGSPDDVSEF